MHQPHKTIYPLITRICKNQKQGIISEIRGRWFWSLLMLRVAARHPSEPGEPPGRAQGLSKSFSFALLVKFVDVGFGPY